MRFQLWSILVQQAYSAACNLVTTETAMTRLFAALALLKRNLAADPCPHWAEYLRQTAPRG